MSAYEREWIAMATTRKMSVDDPDDLVEAVRAHSAARHEGTVTWYTEKKHYGFIEAPAAAATDLFVHASEVSVPLRAGDVVSFVIAERRGRSAATEVELVRGAPKVEVEAPPPPPMPPKLPLPSFLPVFAPAAFSVPAF